MADHTLQEVRKYEEAEEKNIKPGEKPLFHLSARVGWMNDPNGFSCYNGEYHLFYQYNPFDSHWGPMNWGHARSTDLLRWEYLPVALAPDSSFDSDGCFSGSAVTLPDGRQLLIYTGVRKASEEADEHRLLQEQCIAIGDGIDYEKQSCNPVISRDAIPEGLSPYDFRDPKIWKTSDGDYRLVVGARDGEGLGNILMYSSPDAFSWSYVCTLFKNDGTYGSMWECPDFFRLSGRDVLMASPMEMLPKGLEFHNGGGTICVIGDYDDSARSFTPEIYQCIDYGIDFYAPQTMETPDGRRIMVAWMQNWETVDAPTVRRPWFGQMTIPRELSIRDGRLCQQPVRELEKLRGDRVVYSNVAVSGVRYLEGVQGRTVDMTVKVRPLDAGSVYHKFAIRFARNEDFHTSVSLRPHESTLKINRKFSGSRRNITHQRRCFVEGAGSGEICLRIILDRFSAEIFVNDGAYAITTTFYTPLCAEGIEFFADGDAVIDVECYNLQQPYLWGICVSGISAPDFA